MTAHIVAGGADATVLGGATVVGVVVAPGEDGLDVVVVVFGAAVFGEVVDDDVLATTAALTRWGAVLL